MKKTIVKFAIIFIVITIILSWIFLQIFPLLVGIWALFAFLYFIVYYFNKQSFTYHITDKSVRIEKSWIFGNYVRELTFDKISDIRINQGILARMFNCGSLVFVTITGLEVGYAASGVSVGRGLRVGGGTVAPRVVKGRGNMLWDIADLGKVREILMSKITEWREVLQQQKMAISLEKIAGKATQSRPSGSLAEELGKLKALLENGAITKEEYEKAKKKLLE